jgi:hypothetical protein
MLIRHFQAKYPPLLENLQKYIASYAAKCVSCAKKNDIG